MPAQPFTHADLVRSEKIVRELHGLKGFDAWAERIAKALAEERGRNAARPQSEVPIEGHFGIVHA